MKKILFICQANVGRSQMAEGFYNKLTQSQSASSAGVEDHTEKYNYKPTDKIVNVMNEKDVDISGHKIKVLTPEMCKQVEQIVVLCNKEICPDYLKQNEKTVFHEVLDPFEQSIEITRSVRDQIEEIVKSLL